MDLFGDLSVGAGAAVWLHPGAKEVVSPFFVSLVILFACFFLSPCVYELVSEVLFLLFRSLAPSPLAIIIIIVTMIKNNNETEKR